jgi:hypothetical protein
MAEIAAPSILFDSVAQLGFLAPLTHDGFRLPPLQTLAAESSETDLSWGLADPEPDERD